MDIQQGCLQHRGLCIQYSGVEQAQKRYGENSDVIPKETAERIFLMMMLWKEHYYKDPHAAGSGQWAQKRC